ncbi:MAG: hypothetical protein HYT11_00610 [Candidatus Levybacteria bacterium]|nr:hypothetical protein [Candidatus Levybacteria bacterium]
MGKERHKPKRDSRHTSLMPVNQEEWKRPPDWMGTGLRDRFRYLCGNGTDVPPPTLRQRLHRIYPEENKKPLPDGSTQHTLRNILNSRS